MQDFEREFSGWGVGFNYVIAPIAIDRVGININLVETFRHVKIFCTGTKSDSYDIQQFTPDDFADSVSW